MVRFVIVSFGSEYLKYKKALIRSINENVKNHEIIDIELPALKRKDAHLANHIKLNEWVKHIKGNTVLIDADTIVLSDISEVFDLPYDLIYTKRSFNRTIPFNSGVVFVKDSGINIVKKWAELDLKMFKNRSFHRQWSRKYFGFNQASFGCLLDTNKTFNIGHVSSTVYNSCDDKDWFDNYDKAKIVHVKAVLRLAVNRGTLVFPEIQKRILKYYS
jgi:alpha-N-acetylglucosamine transferase